MAGVTGGRARCAGDKRGRLGRGRGGGEVCGGWARLARKRVAKARVVGGTGWGCQGGLGGVGEGGAVCRGEN